MEEKRGFRLITSFFLVNLSLSKIQVNQVFSSCNVKRLLRETEKSKTFTPIIILLFLLDLRGLGLFPIAFDLYCDGY